MERAGRPGDAGPGMAPDPARDGAAAVEPPRPEPGPAGEAAAGHAGPQRGEPGPAPHARPGWLARHPVLLQLAVLAGFLAAAVAASWPRATYLAGRLPATRDTGAYVWGFWWVPHQLAHLASPWFTRSIAAPVGAQLGLHALMPLPDALMTPVTLAFGPSASYNLLTLALPGLLGYAAYRVARLWLPSQAGAIAAGAFFGLSSMLVWRSWYHLNLAAGELFIPLAAEAAVRLTRRPGWRPALVLGVILGAAVLTDQEIALLAIIAAALVVLYWLARPPYLGRKLWLAGLAALTAVVLATPQLVAIAQQARAGGATLPDGSLAKSYIKYSARLPGLIAPSPQISHFGLGHFPFIYTGPTNDGIPSYGLVLTVLAVLGVLAARRRRSTWLLALLWLGCTVLALGPALRVGAHVYAPAGELLGTRHVSRVMPFTWFARLPGLSGFREPDRLMMLGVLPAALLAGATVDWLRYHAAALIAVVVAFGVLEAGWSGNPGIGTMATALPGVDRAIAADHSGSIVVDVPFGIRGGAYIFGAPFDPDAQVLATADGHPRAVGYISRVPRPTITGIAAHPFYAQLVGRQEPGRGTPVDIAAARRDARQMHIGWALLWSWPSHSPRVIRYLRAVGFRYAYQSNGVLVYRLGG